MMRMVIAFTGLLIAAGPAIADDLVGQASVIDGDTIEIHGERIRLFGIDAPESAQTCANADSLPYRCGQATANALAEFIGNKTVRCERRDVDRYGRIVAMCRADGGDLGERLVRAGLALDYPQYSKGAYMAAQRAADVNGAGMWRGPFVEPWLYRTCVRDGGLPSACSTGTAGQ